MSVLGLAVNPMTLQIHRYFLTFIRCVYVLFFVFLVCHVVLGLIILRVTMGIEEEAKICWIGTILLSIIPNLIDFYAFWAHRLHRNLPIISWRSASTLNI